MTEVSKISYRVLRPFSLGNGEIAEVGEIRDDIPLYAADILRHHGKIEPAKGGSKPTVAPPEPVVQPVETPETAISLTTRDEAAPETPEAPKKRGRPAKAKE